MDGTAAIQNNLEALKRILTGLVAMAGLAGALTSPLWGGRREASGGVATLKIPPPGGLTTTDLPTRGR